MKSFFEEIDLLKEKYIKIWADVLAIESPSDYKEGVDRVNDYFIALANSFNWKVEIFEQEKFGNVVAITMNENAKGTTVVLSGHMDTVHPVGSFGENPVKIENGKIYGPGATDCKGGVVAGFLCMEALHNIGFSERPVMMILQSNEEIGSGMNNKAPINYICEKAKGAAAFLNLEGAGSEDKLCLQRKGILGSVFTITGIEAHGSLCAKKGANAIREAAHKILMIEEFKDHNGITCNVGLINGGKKRNIVAGNCQFTVDTRFSNNEEYDFIVSELKKIAETTYVEGCKCEFEITNLRPAMELTERNIDFLNKINKCFKKYGLSEKEIGSGSGGSDAAEVTQAGIPCIDCIGVKGNYIHSTKEYAELASLVDSAKRMAAIIAE